MAEEKFELVSNYAPTGDQPQAIAQLVEARRGRRRAAAATSSVRRTGSAEAPQPAAGAGKNIGH